MTHKMRTKKQCPNTKTILSMISDHGRGAIYGTLAGGIEEVCDNIQQISRHYSLANTSARSIEDGILNVTAAITAVPLAIISLPMMFAYGAARHGSTGLFHGYNEAKKSVNANHERDRRAGIR